MSDESDRAEAVFWQRIRDGYSYEAAARAAAADELTRHDRDLGLYDHTDGTTP